MTLALLRGYPDPFLKHVLGFFDKEAVQVHRVACNAPFGIVLAEDIVARLAVVVFHLFCVLLAFLREFVRRAAVAGLVGLVCAVET